MATNTNPLTLYVAVKQDPTTQHSVQVILAGFNGQGQLITDDNNLIHFSRVAGIPNTPGTAGTAGIMIITEFDGPMDQFLNYFYSLPVIKVLFASLYNIATDPPASPNTLTNFEKFINLNNLTQPDDLLYSYTATVAQIVNRLSPPPPPTTTTTEPLTVYIAVKQNDLSQNTVKLILKNFEGAGGPLPNNFGNFLHYVRIIGVPNQTGKGISGLMVITEFVGPVTPYLSFFYSIPQIRLLFEDLYLIATVPPVHPPTQTNFQNFFNANNLNQPADLSFAYTASVAQILAKFPLSLQITSL